MISQFYFNYQISFSFFFLVTGNSIIGVISYPIAK